MTTLYRVLVLSLLLYIVALLLGKQAVTVNNYPINVVRDTVYKKKKKKD